MSRVSSLAINAADHLVAKGRLDAAASILQNYLSTNAAKPEVLHRLGRIKLAQGHMDEAVRLLKQALKQFQTAATHISTKEEGERVVEPDVESSVTEPSSN